MAENYRPWTWEVPEAHESIKRDMIPRQDAHDRVSGQAVYTRDIRFPGMLYAKILTSPYAHAKILSKPSRGAHRCTGYTQIRRP